MAQNTLSSTFWCLALLTVAAITDGLDGYLARRLNMVTSLGLYLDPLADKLFAAIIVAELVVYRGLPIWLAALVIGRDMIILIAGMVVVKQRHYTTPSNIVGQYTFASVLTLIGFYIITFDFGIRLVTAVTVLLIVVSATSYGYRFARLVRGVPLTPFQDRPVYKILRMTLTGVVIVVCLLMLIIQKM